MSIWVCEDCGWQWPLPGPPPVGAECDNCGGELVREQGEHEQQQSALTGICAVCGAERPVEGLAVELVEGGMVWVCGGIDPATGMDYISDCEQRRGV